jgi:hypothetical protein
MLYIPFYIKQTNNKGLGVFSKVFVPKGREIWRLTGNEYYLADEFDGLPPHIKKDLIPNPNGDGFIRVVGEGESWNHSCDPNTWWLGDDTLSAKRDIFPDEELTYDYATSDVDSQIVYDWECHCGAIDCRKHIKWNDILKSEVYKKYKGHVPSFVEKFVLKFS